MGLTIEENIATLKEHLNTLNVDKGVEFYQEIESIQSAIETMCKYQQIERLIRNYDVTWEYHHMKSTIDEIRKAIEDGNNN